MTNKVSSSHIFGPISDYVNYINDGSICIDKHENYQKRSHRNRYDIVAANGSMSLTIPLRKGKHQGMKIVDVCIANDENWTAIHTKTIITSYRKSPWFEHYIDSVIGVLNSKSEKLFDLNMSALNCMLKLLKIEIPITYTETYFEKLQFEQTFITHYPSYNQVFEYKFGFIQNMSILDLLFCLGPEARSYLSKFPQRH